MSTTLQRQFVLIGLDGIGTSVFHTLPTDWHITVVDTDLHKLNALPELWGDRKVTKICDNASSKLVLEECDLVPSTLLYRSHDQRQDESRSGSTRQRRL